PLLFNNSLRFKKKEEKNTAKLKDLWLFFKQKDQNIWRQIGFLFLYYSGLIGTLAMLKPYLVDMGFSTNQIGFIFGIIGTALGFIASFFDGIIVRKLGRYRSRLLFGGLILL